MGIYNFLCNNFAIPLSDLILGLNVRQYLKEANLLQWQSKDEIDKYQAKKFNDLTQIIFSKVPYYRQYFQEKHLLPRDFASLDDIKKLPILTKSILRENFSALKTEGHKGKIYEMKSSGSTGAQTVVLIDNKINSAVFATQLLFWSWGGFAFGNPHLQTGMSLKRGFIKQLKDIFFRCEYTSAFGLTDTDLTAIIGKIEKKKIQFLFGYASSIYVIAKFMQKNHICLPLNKIFTWGDCLFPHYREIVENSFQCRVQDCYGMGEGLQIAAQCGHGDFLHIAQHKVFVELVDSTNNPISENNVLGRVLVTRFEPGPMPLIRYETGDLASFVAGKCPCGRNLKLISRVQGRDTDVIQSPLGDRLIVHYFTQIFEMIPEIRQFQIRQELKEEIDVIYVPADKFNNTTIKRIETKINEKSKYKFKINFYEVDEIPLLHSNKRRFIVSSIPFA